MARVVVAGRGCEMALQSDAGLWYRKVVNDEAHRVLKFSGQLSRWVRKRMSKPLARELSAEDIVQDVIVDALNNEADLPRGDAQLAAWMRYAALHILMNHERRIRRKRRDVSRRAYLSGSHLIGVLTGRYGRSKTPSGYIAKDEAAAAVRETLESLRPDQRRAVELHHLDELSVDDTARVMGRSPAATAGLVKRGLAKLRSRFRYDSRLSSDALEREFHDRHQ